MGRQAVRLGLAPNAVWEHGLRQVRSHCFYEHSRRTIFVASDVVTNERRRDVYFPVESPNPDFAVAQFILGVINRLDSLPKAFSWVVLGRTHMRAYLDRDSQVPRSSPLVG